MSPLAPMAELVTWAGKNTAHNLAFIPEEKLSWKPAPTANSALEIVGHVVGVLRSMRPALSGGEFTPAAPPTFTTLREAQEALTTDAEDYAAALRQVEARDLARTVHPWGMALPLARAASMPVVDLIHHHGQITYIQTLLGDSEMHFVQD